MVGRLRNTSELLLILLIFMMYLAGCTVNRPTVEGNYTDSAYYRNHVNSNLIRNQISEGFESVLRIQNNVIYRTYQFYNDSMPLRSEVEGKDFEEVAAQSYLDDQSAAGTATVISGANGKYAFLTAAHTVFYPDTIWHYSSAGMRGEERRIQAVSVKQSVNYFVLSQTGIIKLELAAYDNCRDLAIMTNLEVQPGIQLIPLSLPFGNSNILDWGDMVYALGYPKGARMVTLGTASRSDHPVRSILIDASFNRGFSGGALFAVKNDGSGLEFMGVVTSALGENETYLIPENVEIEDFNPDLPYRGNLFVRTTPRINYGITNAVAVNEVQEFLQENRRKLNNMGIVIP